MSVRILAGSHKGRALAASGSTAALRPTSARRREAAFDILRGQLGAFAGLHFLDLFAGTGAIGLEALSQGFAQVTFVENAPSAAGLIRRNLDQLGLGARARILQNDATRLGAAPAPVDVAFLDPPYGRGLAERCLRRLVAGGWIALDTIVLAEIGRQERLVPPPECVVVREHAHGAGRLLRLAAAG